MLLVYLQGSLLQHPLWGSGKIILNGMNEFIPQYILFCNAIPYLCVVTRMRGSQDKVVCRAVGFLSENRDVHRQATLESSSHFTASFPSRYAAVEKCWLHTKLGYFPRLEWLYQMFHFVHDPSRTPMFVIIFFKNLPSTGNLKRTLANTRVASCC